MLKNCRKALTLRVKRVILLWHLREVQKIINMFRKELKTKYG